MAENPTALVSLDAETVKHLLNYDADHLITPLESLRADFDRLLDLLGDLAPVQSARIRDRIADLRGDIDHALDRVEDEADYLLGLIRDLPAEEDGE